MLTVRYARLGVRAGDRLLDLGAGGGRHAFEAMRRGAAVVALDRNDAELKDVAAMFAAIAEAERESLPEGATGAVVHGDALTLPFPDGVFDRVIASEVMEHIPDDAGAARELARVLRPGGTMAVTVPAFLSELGCWALSTEYHAPAQPGGHLRIYRRREITARLAAAGLEITGHHHAHALHTPYWWLKCAVGVGRTDHRLVNAYHHFLVWDLTERPRATRLAEWALSPVMGKSLVVYARKAAR